MGNFDHSADNVLADLLARAAGNDHSSFILLRSLAERRAARQYYKATAAAAAEFRMIRRSLIKEHCKALLAGSCDIETILAAKNLELAIKFYEDEAEIIHDTLREYRAYLLSGHLLSTVLLNTYRSEEDCVDYRTLPWRLF